MFPLIARWAPATGIAFVVLIVAATLLVGDSPGEGAPDAEWVAHYEDDDTQTRHELSFALIGLAGLFFLQFLGSLRGALARAEGEPARITTAAIASGSVFIALALAAHVIGVAVTGTANFYEEFQVDANTARLFDILEYAFFVMSMFAAAAMTLAVTTLVFHTGVFPRWVGWFGVLATIAGLLGFMVFPTLLILVFILILSIYLLRPERGAPAEAAPPVSP
jgi:hypothetical protein